MASKELGCPNETDLGLVEKEKEKPRLLCVALGYIVLL